MADGDIFGTGKLQSGRYTQSRIVCAANMLAGKCTYGGVGVAYSKRAPAGFLTDGHRVIALSHCFATNSYRTASQGLGIHADSHTTYATTC